MITVLTGENSFLLRTELRRLVAAFEAEYTDMGLEKLDGEEVAYDRMREALESLPFLSSKKLVVLQYPSANKEFLEKAANLIKEIPETTDVIVVEPKPDKRTAYYKFLKKSAELREFHEPDEQGLARWLTEEAARRGGKLVAADARYMVQRIGINQQLLSNELDKLLAYNAQITRETIDNLTALTPQSTIFELIDAALAGNTKRALSLYDEQRSMKVEPQQILAMLGWQLHVLAVVKAGGRRDAATIASEAKLNPFVVRKNQALARRLSLSDVKNLVQKALEIDIRLKSEPLDADEAIKTFITSSVLT